MSANSNLITVVFRNHTIPNEAASRAAGRPIFTDLEVCDIFFAANTKTKATFPAHDLEPNATREAAERGEGHVTYAMLYNEQYKAFKNGEVQSMAGTPLSEAPFLTEGKRRELKALNVHTVEALAALGGNALKQIGMSGLDLKTKAQAYLDNAAGSADMTAMAGEIAALRAQLDEERSLREEFTQARQPAPAPVVDPVDTVDFDAMSDEDLKVYIAEQTGSRPKGNPNHDTLVAAAKELAAG